MDWFWGGFFFFIGVLYKKQMPVCDPSNAKLYVFLLLRSFGGSFLYMHFPNNII